ncbi:MAG: hypothetical protein EZS28_016537 [Streblomastix strix]|uniref:BPL/LPL catalytic domain-containing protein n=2 Tax=Streblomastix strix TaxID=222440 RepID=A0A5J4VZC9_9EUKA|nr:MAG: hypothetical protein EZS28_016537 [Streblomastix strix]
MSEFQRLYGNGAFKDCFHYFDHGIDSTQDTSSDLIKYGSQKVLVLAEYQTRGRGTNDRTWSSKLGGLYFSLAFRIGTSEFQKDGCLPLQQWLSTLRISASVAACQAIRKFGCDAIIKWPNDTAISIKQVSNKYIQREEVLAQFCQIFENTIDHCFSNSIRNETLNSIMQTYRQLDGTCGQRIIVYPKSMKIKESYEAIAVRITDEGTLIVQKVDDENCEVELNGEEVSIRKLA